MKTDKERIKELEAEVMSLRSNLKLSNLENPALSRYREALETIARHDGLSASLLEKLFYVNVAKEALK